MQIAAAMGAAVVAIDVDRERLELASQNGAGLVLDSNSMDSKSMKAALRGFSKEAGRKGIGLKIFASERATFGQPEIKVGSRLIDVLFGRVTP